MHPVEFTCRNCGVAFQANSERDLLEVLLRHERNIHEREAPPGPLLASIRLANG